MNNDKILKQAEEIQALIDEIAALHGGLPGGQLDESVGSGLIISADGFIATNYPEGIVSGFVDPNSAMPAQIYEWAKRADPAYYERAWGGIIILLVFLLTMNIIAIILRRRFERRW